ncbi:endonuclease/exonuclease/phosphatase family protein [Salipiger sp. PrR002]|uniref:endonuclease/exonuclease/phosphatase family protein n=1 Tax=Salipiger sp. PrR002 TaxID=2706489 RepID=UPI001F1B8606|nr:endonuclease/exonuclease/phosphatase family protein [Salipiger sp. PrR002]
MTRLIPALFLCAVLALPASAGAVEITLATWHAHLSRKGPGLLLRDILEARAPLPAILDQIAEARPDVLLLTDMDFDLGQAALDALADQLAARGADYPHRFALRPNSGMESGADLDADGRLGGPRDAQGYGAFSGQHGMAVLARHPLRLERDFSALLWRDLPGTRMHPADPAPEVQRLSSTAHWVLRLDAPGQPLQLLCYSATPPVFDGPEDRNGRRNADELALWRHYLDGALGPAPEGAFVLIGNANLDPEGGEGLRGEMRALLDDARLQDPLPQQATAEWDSTGPLRVSYVLPSAGLTVGDARVYPAIEGQRHRLVTVTLSTQMGG